MNDFAIHIAEERGSLDEPRKIGVRVDEIVFTRLIREGEDAPNDYLDAPPAQLAFWLVDHWWRLVSECVPASGQTPEWRMAHDLSSLSGYAWPRLAIWGEGERIGLSSRSDPLGVVGPVRYLTDALTYVPAEDFSKAALTFVETVAAEESGMASDWRALKGQLQSLREERADPDVAAWRRLEAQLGYDVDEAPDTVMEALDQLAANYGAPAIAEAALAAPGPDAANRLASEIESALGGHHWQCDLARAAQMIGPVSRANQEAPWELGEKAAKAVRGATGYTSGPLTNAALSEIFSVKTSAFRSRQTTEPDEHAYGLRLNTGRKRGEVVSLAASWSADRRFEFSRALGDAIWTQGERLGPITRAKSERQKFQRAFAQSLLCPYDDLVAYIGGRVTDGAISAAARHFLVSERVVRTLLVNKQDLVRARLSIAPRSTSPLAEVIRFEDAVEAA